MPTLTPIRLAFAGGLHVGTRGVNLEEADVSIPSDTLFAAMLDGWRRLGQDPQRFAQPFVADPPDPPFLLTSAFPLAGDVRFFPMPVDAARLFSADTIGTRGKTIKRIRYLSEGLLRRVTAGERLDAWLFPEDEYTDPTTGVALQGGTLWLTRDEIDALPQEFQTVKNAAGNPQPRPAFALRRLSVWKSARVPRVTIDRTSSASNIFHAGKTTFNQDCGLWFGIQWRQPAAAVPGTSIAYKDAVDQILAVLQSDGLGGERSTGYGAFATDEAGKALSFDDAKAGEPLLLLSRYHPRGSELPAALTAAPSAYRLTAVAGWLRSPDDAAQRRKRLMLVAEGSIVCPPSTPAGDVSDVRPSYNNQAPEFPHPVYRYGMAVGVGLAKAGDNNG